MLLTVQGNKFRTQFIENVQGFWSNIGVFLADLLWNLLCILFIFLAAKLILRVISHFTWKVMQSERYHKTDSMGKRTDTIMTLTRSTMRYVVYTGAVVLSLILLGSGDALSNLLVTAGIGSVAIGFGAQSLVKDVVTGFFLMFENQFSVGDYIKVDQLEGTVEATALRVTYLRSYTGEQYIIPNGSIVRIVNYSRGNALALVDFSVPYEEPSELVFATALQAAQEYAAQNPTHIIEPPYIRGIKEYKTYGYTVSLACLTAPLYQWQTARGIRRLILERFEQRGISFAGPSFSKQAGEKILSPEPPAEDEQST